MKFKVIATDIDGTITDKHERLYPKAIELIRELEKMGIKIMLVTGHMLCAAETLSHYIGTSGPIVSENGCVIVKKRWDDPIILGSRNNTEKALSVLKEYFGDSVKVKPIIKYRLVDISLKRTFNPDLGNKILNEKKIPAYLVDSNFAIHIIDKNVNKGVGTVKAGSLIGVTPNEMIGIGDGKNDYYLLKSVGYSIALAHAPEKLKEIADYVTRKPYGEGFVEAINYLKEQNLI